MARGPIRNCMLFTFPYSLALGERVLRKRVIAVWPLDRLSAEGKTGCFPLKKSGRFVFAEQAIGTVRKADRLQAKSFASGKRWFKSKKKSRLAGITL